MDSQAQHPARKTDRESHTGRITGGSGIAGSSHNTHITLETSEGSETIPFVHKANHLEKGAPLAVGKSFTFNKIGTPDNRFYEARENR